MLNLEQLSFVLNILGVDTKNVKPFSNNMQILIKCPLARWTHARGEDNQPSLSIHFNDPAKPTLFRCWACKNAGKIYRLVETYGELAESDEHLKLAEKLKESDNPLLSTKFSILATAMAEWKTVDDKMSPPKPLSPNVLDGFGSIKDYPEAVFYLTAERKRKFNPEYLEFLFRCKYDAHNRRIVFPVYGKDGQLYGAVGRTIDKGVEPRYYNYFGFSAGKTLGGFQVFNPKHHRLFIAEGFMDVINAREAAVSLEANVLCTWHAEVSEYQADQILALDKTNYLWYDNDEAGNKGAEKALKLLKGGTRVILPENDDLGDLSPTMIKDYFNESKKRVLKYVW